MKGEKPDKLFKCAVGLNSCMVDSKGFLRLCPSLVNKNYIYDLKKGSLKKAWENFIPKVLKLNPQNAAFKETCGKCHLINLCSWCPAKADLETDCLDGFSKYFCSIANKRYEYCK
jgi:radical SAM protein with 4Fe4S-binding SPASM domain